jgi:hypothetical protein
MMGVACVPHVKLSMEGMFVFRWEWCRARGSTMCQPQFKPLSVTWAFEQLGKVEG